MRKYSKIPQLGHGRWNKETIDGISKKVIETVKYYDSATTLRGYSTLGILGILTSMSFVMLILWWENIISFTSKKGEEMLASKEIQKKAEELSKGLRDFLMYDADTLNAAYIFVFELLKDTRNVESLKRILNSWMEDEDLCKNSVIFANKVAENMMLDEEFVKLTLGFLYELIQDEKVKKVLLDHIWHMMADEKLYYKLRALSGQVFYDQRYSFGKLFKEAAYIVSQDEEVARAFKEFSVDVGWDDSVNSAAGNAFWQAIKLALPPWWR